MPTAELIFEDKQVLDDGSIIEMRIWRVPSPVPPATHVFKYSLFYGRPGELVCYSITSAAKGTTATSGKLKGPIALRPPKN
jgi:hypothetical protein